MASTVPTIQSAKIISGTTLKLTWSQSTSPDVGVKGYGVYRGSDPVLIGSTTGAGSTTYTDSGLSFDNTYVYSVRSIDNNDVGSSLSDYYTKIFTNSKFILDELEKYLEANGAQNMILVVQQDEIPVLIAMEEYISDVVIAIDNSVVFGPEFRNDIEDNLNSFWYIPMDGLWNYTVGLPYSDNVTKNRKFHADVKIQNKLANVFQRIYQDARHFFTL